MNTVIIKTQVIYSWLLWSYKHIVIQYDGPLNKEKIYFFLKMSSDPTSRN